ncbi:MULTISPECIES: amidohydrolase [unclassified Achromobacter]|uniref:amidohydrolase family protein n=1 Tax=unclassified Achromobacter TaxID=2626865 RepID=UPI000B5197F1|nr:MULTISPECIES: amidohydrolase family protein [unclassified Achromobacter]OWT75418.1 GntR family transcriptional regulator [Achromobacter sp. HZ28]OWT76078.1 GntR family transcriptional regulator [Achromobacter sp. HZ34]
MTYIATEAAPLCLVPGDSFTRASFRVPALACDAHAHVVSADSQAYPVVANRSYTPVPTPESDYLAMLDATGMARGVLVQISVYGTDNRYMVEVLRRHPARLRGVAVVAPDVSEQELTALHDAGVRGLRLNVLFGGGVGFDAMETLAAKIEQMGWHLQLLVDARQFVDLMPRLTKLTLPVVVDHMGHMPVELGTEHAAFKAMKHLMVNHGWWAKLSGAYRVSSHDAHGQGKEDHGVHGARVTEWAQALVDAAPDRLVYGSDWPHVATRPMPDAGVLRNLLATWIPDEGARHKVLVDNPARLYGF